MWGKLLGVATLSIAASCAVLTVDVDVYKGPMANEPDVQAQQLTAMAVAARPVLIRLRDSIEEPLWAADKVKFEREVKGQPFVHDRELIKSAQGLDVNRVLGLYLDQVDPVVASFVGQGRDIFEECARLRGQLEQFDDDEKLWERVSRTESNGTAYDALMPLIAPAAREGRPAKSRSASMAAEFLVGEAAGATRQFVAISDVQKILPKLRVLSSDDELRSELAERVSQIAKAYLAGREQLAQGLDIALSFQIAVALHRVEIDNSEAILESNARLISLLIQPQQLALLMADRAARSNSLDALITRQRERLRDLPKAPLPQVSWSPIEYAQAATVLESLLIEEPVQAADALRSLHASLRTSAESVAIESRPSADFRFGLARALTFDEAERTEVVEAFRTFRSTIALLGDVWVDGGRLEDGLLTKIGRYLEARDREHAAGDNEQKTSKRERQRLMDGLVHFAEKLRFLASHDAVLGGSDGQRESVSTYVIALESIGNSILTLANEEQHRRTYETTDQPQKSNKAAIDALNAVTTAFAELAKSADAEKAAGASVSTPSAESGEKEKDAETDAADKTEAARAKFAEQLDAAEKLINNAVSLAVYIRPPWAYLRNSTPISALQPGEALTGNMLADHALRALPHSGVGDPLARLARHLDQQYWQNINRVRVAGMGNTSYALIKDDIGNWYVKGYSADPKPVLEGLQGMALAAQSGAMGLDLFARKDAAAKANEKKTPLEPVESTTLVGKQAKRFENVYADEAKADSTAARAEHGKFVDELSKAWEGHSGWEEGGDKPLQRKRMDLAATLKTLLPEPGTPPDNDAKSPVLAADALAVLAKSLDFHDRALALLDAGKLVDGAKLSSAEADVSKLAGELENARNQVALAKARLEAIQGVVGAPPSDLNKAKSDLSQLEQRLVEVTEKHESARNERDTEAERVAAAKQLVSELRADVRNVVGGPIRRRLDARRKSSESYATALEVLSQGAADSN